VDQWVRVVWILFPSPAPLQSVSSQLIGWGEDSGRLLMPSDALRGINPAQASDDFALSRSVCGLAAASARSVDQWQQTRRHNGQATSSLCVPEQWATVLDSGQHFE
jgi:hypothetical protein